MKKRIVIVDAWTKGIRCCKPIIHELSDEYDIYFVHLNSLMSFTPQIREELKEAATNKDYIEPLLTKTIDLSAYNYSFLAAFGDLKPDLVLFVSLHGLEQRHANHIANALQLPCMLFMHGLKGWTGNINYYALSNSNILYKARRFLYYNLAFYYYLKDYFKLPTNRRTRNSRFFAQWFDMLFRHHRFVESAQTSDNTTYRTMCVTCEQDIEFFIRNFRLSKEQTKFAVIGHVESDVLIKDVIQRKLRVSERVTFISQPLVQDRIVTRVQFVKIVTTLASVFASAKIPFVFRPHPDNSPDLVRELVDKHHIEISNRTLAEDVYESSCLIGVNSTVMFSSQALGIPQLLVNIPSYPIHEALLAYQNALIVNDSEIRDRRDELIKFYERNKGANARTNPEELSRRSPVKLLRREVENVLGEAA